MVSVFEMLDSFRSLHLHDSVFSRYYTSDEYGEGATRIDRTYHYGDVGVKKAQYIGVAFSDHQSLIVTVSLPGQFWKVV